MSNRPLVHPGYGLRVTGYGLRVTLAVGINHNGLTRPT